MVKEVQNLSYFEKSSDMVKEQNLSYLEISNYYAIILLCTSWFLTLINLNLYHSYAFSWQVVITFYVPFYMMVHAICLWLHYFCKHEFVRFIIVSFCMTTTFMGMMVYTLGYVWPIGTIYEFETSRGFHPTLFLQIEILVPGSLYVLLLGASVLTIFGKIYEEEFQRELGGVVIEEIEKRKSQRISREVATSTIFIV